MLFHPTDVLLIGLIDILYQIISPYCDKLKRFSTKKTLLFNLSIHDRTHLRILQKIAMEVLNEKWIDYICAEQFSYYFYLCFFFDITIKISLNEKKILPPAICLIALSLSREYHRI